MAHMRVNMATTQQRHYAVGPVAGNFQQPQMQHMQQYAHQSQLYMRQAPQHVTGQPVQQHVARQRRVTMAPEVHQRQAALLAEHREKQPLQQKQVLVQQRAAHVQKQQLQRQQQMQLQQQREEEEAMQAALDSSTRTPAPLPRAWRAEYELSPVCAELGGGAFAEVFRVQHRQTQKGFAVKVMHRPNFALRGIERQIEAEIEAMRLAANLSRDLQEELYILRLLDVVEEGEYVYLLLELCDQGDLLRKLHHEPSQRISEQDAVILAKQLMAGLKTVHSLGFIHRDIKPDNLLCNEEGLLKIADFGWCCTCAEAPTALAGTFQYMAPEVLSHVPQTVQADVWSAGVTLYQMMVGRPLLQTYLGPGATNISEHDPHRATAIKQQWLVNEINTTCPPPMENRPSDLSVTCWDFLRQLLVPDPNQRVTVESALKHPWLKLADIFEEGAKEAAAAAAAAEEKDARSPPPGIASKDSIGNVPTPLKPRSYDPSRNMAYTPPVTPEMTPERTLWPHGEFGKPSEKENNHSPEVSPQRKTRLQMSADRVSGKWGSPKDTLLERSAGRVQISKLTSPPRNGSSPAAASNRRKTIASQMPATSQTHEIGMREAASSGEGAGGRFVKQDFAQTLLDKLQSCDEGIREMKEMYYSSVFADSQAFDSDPQRPHRLQDCLTASSRALEPMPELPEEGPVRHSGHASVMVPSSGADLLSRSRRDVETDALTASAPPGLVNAAATPMVPHGAAVMEHRRVARTLKSPVKTVVEAPSSARGSAEKSPAKTALASTFASLANGREVPPMPVPSGSGAAASAAAPGWKAIGTTTASMTQVVRNSVVGCFSPPPRYAQGSPIKPRAVPQHIQQQMQQSPAPMSPVITRTVVRMPQGGSGLYGASQAAPATVWTATAGTQQTQLRQPVASSSNTRRRASAPGTWVRP